MLVETEISKEKIDQKLCEKPLHNGEIDQLTGNQPKIIAEVDVCNPINARVNINVVLSKLRKVIEICHTNFHIAEIHRNGSAKIMQKLLVYVMTISSQK